MMNNEREDMTPIADICKQFDDSSYRSRERRALDGMKRGNSAPPIQRLIGVLMALSGLTVMFLQVFTLQPSFVWLLIGIVQFAWGVAIERDI